MPGPGPTCTMPLVASFTTDCPICKLATFLAEQLHANEFTRLPIEMAHVAAVATLAFHHRDPFDRLLAAQALHDSLPIVSADPVFRKYKLKCIW